MVAHPAVGLLAAVAFGLSAGVFGHGALKRLGFAREDRTAALSVTLGLGLIAQALFVLGLFGGLRPGVIGAAALGAHVLCRNTWRELWPHLRLRLTRRTKGSRAGQAPWIGAGVALPIVTLGLYPPTGWDETAYHLPYVRAFLEAGGLVFAEFLRYPVFPQTGELLFLAAGLLGGDVAAALTQTLALFAAAGLLADWGRRSFHPRVGLWAAALWIGTPLVVWLGTMAYVDILLSLFVIAGFACWHRFRDGDGHHFLTAAALFVGFAAATKYLGLFFCGVLGVLTLGRALRLRRLGSAVWITVIATATLAPWYLRIYAHTGNPVFPFYAPLFGETVWTTKHDQLLFDETADGAAAASTDHLSDGLVTLARLPWDAVFNRSQFSNMAPLTPWYLLLVPLCAAPAVLGTGRRGANSRRLVACFGFYAFFWLGLEHDLRFLLPGLPLLNLALVDGLDRLTRRVRGPVQAFAVAALLLAPGWLYAGYKILNKGPVPLTATARADFLDRQVEGHRAVRWLNERHGDSYTVMTLFGGRLRHHARGRLYGDAWGPDGHDIIRDALRRGTLPAELERRNATYFLVERRFLRNGLPERFHRRFELVVEDGSFGLYRRLQSK